jgi:hypothetical protein
MKESSRRDGFAYHPFSRAASIKNSPTTPATMARSKPRATVTSSQRVNLRMSPLCPAPVLPAKRESLLEPNRQIRDGLCLASPRCRCVCYLVPDTWTAQKLFSSPSSGWSLKPGASTSVTVGAASRRLRIPGLWPHAPAGYDYGRPFEQALQPSAPEAPDRDAGM